MTLVLWGHYYLAPWIIIKGIIGATHTLDNCTGLSYHRVLPWKFKSFSNYHKNNHVTIVFVYKTVALKGYLEARGVNNCCEYQGVLPMSSFQRSKLLSIRWFLKHESGGEIKESYDCLPVTKHFFLIWYLTLFFKLSGHRYFSLSCLSDNYNHRGRAVQGKDINEQDRCNSS